MLDTEAASFILFCFISKHTCLGLACIVSRAQYLYNSDRLGSCWSPSRNRIKPSRKLANSLSSSAIPQNPPRRQLIDQSPRTAWEKRHEFLKHHAERRMDVQLISEPNKRTEKGNNTVDKGSLRKRYLKSSDTSVKKSLGAMQGVSISIIT